MFVAYNAQGERVYADEYQKGSDCFCPECRERVKHRNGTIRIPHFAHVSKSNCKWGSDKDSKSEWHIRMQNYFPREQQEVRFEDPESGEVHIADVFVESKNTVIEFQHSPIDEEEFHRRTAFHFKYGRRVVWVFDESKENPAENEFGRFKKDEYMVGQWPYQDLIFKWMYRRRRFLANGVPLNKAVNFYSVCVYTGTEGDVLHRIVEQMKGFEYVYFSLHSIELSKDLDVDDFFRIEQYWGSQSPLKERLAKESAQRNKNVRGHFQSNVTKVKLPSRVSRKRNTWL